MMKTGNFSSSRSTGFLSRWFGAQREANRLGRDAAVIIETAGSTGSAARNRETALRLRDELEAAHSRGGDDATRYGPIIEHFRVQHREARRRRDDTALTVLTLVIIYLRAEKIGDDAKSARDRIDAFISDWTRV